MVSPIANKTSILALALVLISYSTNGIERGISYNYIIEFGFGLILIAIYHFWFLGNGDGK